MNYRSVLRSLCSSVVCLTILIGATAYGQDLAADVAVTKGGKSVYASSVTLVVDKATSVKAGDEYTLVVTPSLGPNDRVRVAVLVNHAAGLNPISMVTEEKLGKPAKILNGMHGDQEIALTLRLKQ